VTQKGKFYCYVDESGQDTQGRLFIVSVVIADEDREELLKALEAIERETGKNRLNWSKTTYARKLAYVRRVLKLNAVHGKLNFALYQHSRNYFDLTVQTIIRALNAVGQAEYKATVLIDALPPSQARIVSRLLHQSGVHIKKVRGVRRDENDALIRLADALCGFVRAAHENQPEMLELFKQATPKGILKDVLSGEE
jgi:hypothetical protein